MREFEQPEQRQFKPRIKPLARAALAVTLLFGATGTGVVSGSGSGEKISKELNSTATRISLVTDVPTPCVSSTLPPIPSITDSSYESVLKGDGSSELSSPRCMQEGRRYNDVWNLVSARPGEKGYPYSDPDDAWFTHEYTGKIAGYFRGPDGCYYEIGKPHRIRR